MTYDPPLKFLVVFIVNPIPDICNRNLGPGHAFMATGRAQMAEALFGNFPGILSDAVVSEHDDEFVIIYSRYDTPHDRIHFHKEIGDQYANIRIHHRPQVYENTAFTQPFIFAALF